MNDTIYRQDAIKVLEELSACKNFGVEIGTDDETYIGKYEAITAISDLPSADRPQEWIPCSERLPTKAGHCLCSFNKPNRIDNIYVDLAYWTGGRWYGYLTNEINAWMPLPKPWEGVDDE